MSRSPEFSTPLVEGIHSIFTNFFLWLAMVELEVEADPQALASAQEYLERAENPAIVASFYPHTGHTDSLLARKAIETLMPEVLPRFRFVSAKDTWANPLKRAFARATVGDPYLFDRQVDGKQAKAELTALKAQVDPRGDQPGWSLGIYPQGTRAPGAPIGNSAIHTAYDKGVGLGIFNIYNAADVFPKVPKNEQANLFLRKLINRLRSRREDMHQVRVKLIDFIPPGLSRPELKQRYLAAHNEAVAEKTPEL